MPVRLFQVWHRAAHNYTTIYSSLQIFFLFVSGQTLIEKYKTGAWMLLDIEMHMHKRLKCGKNIKMCYVVCQTDVDI